MADIARTTRMPALAALRAFREDARDLVRAEHLSDRLLADILPELHGGADFEVALYALAAATAELVAGGEGRRLFAFAHLAIVTLACERIVGSEAPL